MPTYKSFAVAGLGLIGNPIAEALLATGVSVVVLTRSSSKSLPAGAKSAVVDYEDTASITKALKEHKVEVVVSTLGGAAILSQIQLADAAKAAGVKLFAPSEFGVPTHGYTEGFQVTKEKVIVHLKSIGLPYARIYTGVFIGGLEFVTEAGDGKAQIIGKGDSKVSFTAEKDVGGFVAYILTNLPPSELENKIFRIEGDRLTLKEAIQATGKNLEVVHVEKLSGPAAPFLTLLHQIAEEGRATTGWDQITKTDGTGEKAAGSANKLWPGHKWTTVKEYYAVA